MGMVVTAILQSSSATTVAAVGFVRAELMTFPQALGIIFGANIGTTITGWMWRCWASSSAWGRLSILWCSAA